MVSSVTYWYDVFFWGKWEYFGQWCTIVQYVHVCLTDGIAYCTQLRIILPLIVQCVRICVPDGIAYCTTTCHDSILLHMDMLIHCSTAWTIYPFYPIPLPYATRSYDVFPKVPCVWAQCINMLKYTKYFFMISCWIIIQHFHFKLLELNLNVHLCFNYIVLI